MGTLRVVSKGCGRCEIVVHLALFSLAYTLSLCNQGHNIRDRVSAQMQQGSTSGSNTPLSLAGDESGGSNVQMGRDGVAVFDKL